MTAEGGRHPPAGLRAGAMLGRDASDELVTRASRQRQPERADAAPAHGRITIRPASLADLDVVVELRLELLAEHGENPIYGRLRPDAEDRARRLFAKQLESPEEIIYLAERDGVVVGILRCAQALGSLLLLPEQYAYVSSVYVRPEARRSGVLHALLAEAERWCERRGLTEIRLHNAADSAVANAAWSALGFEVVEHLRLRRIRR